MMMNRIYLKKIILNIIIIFVISIFCSNFYYAKEKSEDDLYTEKIEEINDGYYYKLMFKKKYINNEFYGDYETLYVDEFVIYNKNKDLDPLIIKASSMGWNNFKCEYYSTGRSIIYIIDLNDKRYVRVYKNVDDEVYYDLYDENGKKIETDAKICDYIDDKKDLILIQSGSYTSIYDLDFKQLKSYNKKYNYCQVIKFNNPYGDLIYLGIKDKYENCESGGIILDKKMNVILENLSFEPHIILNDEFNIESYYGEVLNYKYILNNKNNLSYNYVLLSNSVEKVKYKNGNSCGETYIVDLNYNKVFSVNKKLVSETEYFKEEEHVILLVFEDSYYFLDNDMKIIESGDVNDKEYKNKKEMYDFNNNSRLEFVFNSP